RAFAGGNNLRRKGEGWRVEGEGWRVEGEGWRVHFLHPSPSTLHPPPFLHMNTVAPPEPLTLSATPGRVRLHLPAWSGTGPRHLEQRLRQVSGVRQVQANPLTHNVLVQYDPEAAGLETIRAALATALESAEAVTGEEPPPPPALVEGGWV